MRETPHHETIELIGRLKDTLDLELRAYPYPITACDVAFKLYAEQRGLTRVVLAGFAGEDGLTVHDAYDALAALLATPLALGSAEVSRLRSLADALADGGTVPG